ncbi:hypothetical protein AVEN_177189-1 [Araneus ventricosus]|uniref:Uncharacterized protein n=1 Tax=Araneus ventricosus TaxID=182803 RepID=A0A4Y2RVL5_ARAVE|nr:hypothetical protein AVEN_177189-1 [Araneus ventricosus]
MDWSWSHRNFVVLSHQADCVKPVIPNHYPPSKKCGDIHRHSSFSPSIQADNPTNANPSTTLQSDTRPHLLLFPRYAMKPSTLPYSHMHILRRIYDPAS